MTETEATYKTEEGFGDVLKPWPKQHERFGKSYWGERAVSLVLMPGEVVSGCIEPVSIRAGGNKEAPYHLWYERESGLDDGRISGPLFIKLEMNEAQAEELMFRLRVGLGIMRGEMDEAIAPTTIEEARVLFNKRSDDV